MLTIERLKAHEEEAASINEAMEKLARDIAEARKPGCLSPYRGDVGTSHNNYWSFNNWELLGDKVYVEFEFISQSPDTYTVTIEQSCFPLKAFR